METTAKFSASLACPPVAFSPVSRDLLQVVIVSKNSPGLSWNGDYWHGALGSAPCPVEPGWPPRDRGLCDWLAGLRGPPHPRCPGHMEPVCPMDMFIRRPEIVCVCVCSSLVFSLYCIVFADVLPVYILYIYLCVCVCTCMHICVCVCVCMSLRWLRVNVCVCIGVCVCVCVCVCVAVCMCICLGPVYICWLLTSAVTLSGPTLALCRHTPSSL